MRLLPSHTVAVLALVGLAVVSGPSSGWAAETATGRTSWLFEAGPVRPIAISADRTRLYVTNLPDGRLEIFDISTGGLRPLASVPVGLEPVAVAARDDGTAWVVNHLSDSVSIVEVGAGVPRVLRTLQVGDEPRDIVFAGPDESRAFVTAAHRGQHSAYPLGEPERADVGRADVWVFDVDALGDAPGGEPSSVLSLFGATPRALARSSDGTRVYVAVLHSGNRTATVSEFSVCPGPNAAPCQTEFGPAPGRLPEPWTNAAGVPMPEAGLIVRQDPSSGAWLDELGRDWQSQIYFDLPDLDVFAIDVTAEQVTIAADSWSDVGTTLFNMVVNPASGVVYVSNTEARNRVRFEGPGQFAAAFKPEGEPATVRGHLAEARITVIDEARVRARHLNKHIPYASVPMVAGVADASLATPLQMAITADGETLYVAAFGSGKVGVMATAELEADTFVPDASNHIELPGGGPAGLALDEARQRLFVYSRFDNAVVVVDTATHEVVQWLPLHTPEPEEIVAGRPFLYDARLGSSNGEASCASCHVFGDWDGLVWDLGNPDANVEPNDNPVLEGTVEPLADFHPMKGPMSTQTLRGLRHHGAQHWRGDRQGNATEAFRGFNVAFDGLLGRDEGPLTETELDAFTQFVLALTPPPNPGRRLDNALRPDEAQGRAFFFETGSVVAAGGLRPCVDCHELDPALGFFGTSGRSGPAGAGRSLKVPQLRNVYRKFGAAGEPRTGFSGPQVRSTGLSHDGSGGGPFEFLQFPIFVLTQTGRERLVQYISVFDSTLAPVVGQQTTRSGSSAASDARIALLSDRAATPFTLRDAPSANECDLVVHGAVGSSHRGWLRRADGQFRSDRAAEAPVSLDTLKALADLSGVPLTFTCSPPGSGRRRALDRDEDGTLDGDERIAGSDPANPASFPGVCGDGLDNDADGFADAEDPGCGGAAGLSENPPCSDGLDNDGDRWIDYPDDPDCPSASAHVEFVPAPTPGASAAVALGTLAWMCRRRGVRGTPPRFCPSSYGQAKGAHIRACNRVRSIDEPQSEQEKPAKTQPAAGLPAGVGHNAHTRASSENAA